MPTTSSSITTRPKAAENLPTVLAPGLDHALRVFVARLDPPLAAGRSNYEIAAHDAPSDEKRQDLDFRRTRIATWLLPAGPKLVAEQLQLMIGSGMKFRDEEPGSARQRAALMAQDLMDMPGFAIILTCQDFRKGIIGEGKWLPETGVIRAAAQRRVHALAKERRDIDAVLNAKVKPEIHDAARKARVLDDARRLLQEMPLNARRRDAERQGLSPEVEGTRSMEQGHDEPLAAYQERMLRHASEVGSKATPQIGPALRKRLQEQGVLPPPTATAEGDEWRGEVA